MTQHSANDLRSPGTQHFASWSIRFLLAALLFFTSEILLWTNPPTRSLIDWALLAFGYLALSALLLEIAARYRLRDLFGLLALAGFYGMINALILNPNSALIDLPRTLISRAMGAHALAGLIALALFLELLNGGLRSRRTIILLLLLALIVGVAWGTWARWSPGVVSGRGISPGSETAPAALLFFGALGIGLIALGLLAVRRYAAGQTMTAADLRLDRRGWAFTLIVLIALLVIHLLQGEVNVLALTVLVTLCIFSIMILWFQQRKKGATLLDGLASVPVSWTAPILLAVVFALAGGIGFFLPRATTASNAASDPLALIGALFTAYGLIWLPAVSIVLGARAFSRQARAMRL